MRNLIVEGDLRNITHSGLDWSSFAGKTILISGANGFLPAYMVETLLYLNEKGTGEIVKVIGIVRSKEKAQARFLGYSDRPDLRLIEQDICHPISITERVDYIIHAASQASPKYYGKDPVGTLSPNILGTYNLLEFARAKKIDCFLFFSSGEVYGEVKEYQIPTEEDSYGYINPVDVRSCYAEAKRMGETMCISWHHQYGVPTKIVRPFHTYGPGMSLDDGRVYADFVSDVVHNRDIVMKSDGTARRAFCYLADATIGFFQVLLQGKDGQAYNVGNDKAEISILELANLLVSLFPDKGLKVIRQERGDQPGYLKSKITRNCPEISKMRGLGWEPKTSLQDGFRKTIESYLS
ncbi:MAG: NAD-dependent epimerase/dehydratase family protein [Nitrospirota bacterium]